MELTANQKELIHRHATWLAKDANRAKKIYDRTIDIAGRHTPKGEPDRWLLYLTNNVYIHQMTGGAHSV